MKYDEMVIERNINVQSNCEHHFVTKDEKLSYLKSFGVLNLGGNASL